MIMAEIQPTLSLCVALIRAGVDKRGVTVVLGLLDHRLGCGGCHSAAARIRRRLIASILVLGEVAVIVAHIAVGIILNVSSLAIASSIAMVFRVVRFRFRGQFHGEINIFSFFLLLLADLLLLVELDSAADTTVVCTVICCGTSCCVVVVVPVSVAESRGSITLAVTDVFERLTPPLLPVVVILERCAERLFVDTSVAVVVVPVCSCCCVWSCCDACCCCCCCCGCCTMVA